MPKNPVWTIAAVLAAVLPGLAARPAHGQDAAASIARAQRILAEIDALLERILTRQAAQRSPGAGADGWTSLFDGMSMGAWKRTDFGGGGDVRIDPAFQGGPGALLVEMGAALSGFHWTGDVPRTRYEVALEVMKLEGNDFMCGLTFPVGASHASLILGGWGGTVVGISSIDNRDASENETTKFIDFPRNRWYRVRMRVTPDRLEAWVDDRQIVDQVITGRKISLRFGEISRSTPLGISTFQTRAAFRSIRLRRLE